MPEKMNFDNRYNKSAGGISIFLLSLSLASAAIISRDYLLLCVFLLLSMAALIVFRQGYKVIITLGRYSIFLAAFIFTLHLFSHEGAKIFGIWFLSATKEGALTGILYALKLLVFTYSGYLIFAAVDPFELLIPAERATSYIGRFGRPLASAAMAFFLAMRFIPELIERGKITAMAFKSRGIESERGLKKKAQFATALIVPLFAGSIKKAGLIAMALDIKGYGTRYYRARIRPARLNFASVAVAFLSAVILAIGILTA